MFERKYLMILIFLIIGICAVSAVSAGDVNGTDEIIAQEVSDDLAVGDEDVLTADVGTYTDLKNRIESNYNGNINLNKDYAYSKNIDDKKGTYNSITIEKSITINGKGHIIYANDANPFIIEDGAKVKMYNVTFYGDYSSKPATSWGGAIWNWGNLYMENCNFINCQATDDAGAISNSGDLNLKYCAFINCHAKNYGGAIYNQWKAKLDFCFFKDNSVTKSGSNGGAIFNDLDLFINASVFVDNVAKNNGGAVYTDGDAWIQNSIFGTYIDDESETDDSMIGKNKAKLGSSIYNKIGSVCSIDKCFFNETSSSDVEVISNVIALNSLFEDHNIAEGCVMNNCSANKMGSASINSTGLSFEVTPSIETSFDSGKNLEVTVTSSPNGEKVRNAAVELVIDGDTHKTIMTNSNGVAIYKASRMTPGKHNIVVRLYNSTLSDQQVSVPVTVKKAKLTFKVSKFTTTYKSGKHWTIKVRDASNNKPAANVEIIVKVYTGKKYVNYAETTDSKGICKFADTDYGDTFKKGTHKVILSTDQNGYTADPVTSYIKVNAKKLYIAGESNKFKDCGQLILGAYDKEKKKMVSGIKLQIKVFTGKKYKTFNLVTKKSKDIGDIGVLLETNAFSAGKHKVTVKITTPNYTGSDKGYLVIPKSAKKYDKFTYVISNGKGKFVRT